MNGLSKLLKKHEFGENLENDGVFLLKINKTKDLKRLFRIWESGINVKIEDIAVDPYLRLKLSSDYILVELPGNVDSDTMKEILGEGYSKKLDSFLRNKIILFRGLKPRMKWELKSLDDESHTKALKVNDIFENDDTDTVVLSKQERERIEELFGVDSESKNIADYLED